MTYSLKFLTYFVAKTLEAGIWHDFCPDVPALED